MIEVIKNAVQLSFIKPEYPYYQFPKYVYAKISDSFDEFFRKMIVPLIPVHLVGKLYSSATNVRPAKAAIQTVAAILYIQTTGIKEDFFLDHIHTDIAIQYAIGTEDTAKQPFSAHSLTRLRNRIRAYNLRHTEEDIWELITGEIDESIAQKMGLYKRFDFQYSSAYRIDSLMIKAHAAPMTRIQLVYTVTRNAVLLLLSLGIEDNTPVNLAHYLDEKDYHKYTYYKGNMKELKAAYAELGLEIPGGSETDNDPRKNRLKIISDLRLRKLAQDAIEAKTMLETNNLTDNDVYRTLLQVISEQLNYDENSNTATPKDGKDITGGSMQSVYDPQMTYRRKNEEKNYGYVGCVAELYNKEGYGSIVWRKIKPNIYSDQKFADEFYDHIIQKHNLSEENANRISVSCDALFTSAELQAKVKGKRIDIFCASTGYTPDPILAEFILSDDLQSVCSCPVGNIPDIVNIDSDSPGNVITIKFLNGLCAECEYSNRCKSTTGKRGVSTIKLKLNQVLAAKNIASLDDPIFHQFVNYRNGVESIPAALRKGQGVDDCPNFGEDNQKMDFYTCVTGHCIKKYYAYYKDILCSET